MLRLKFSQLESTNTRNKLKSLATQDWHFSKNMLTPDPFFSSLVLGTVIPKTPDNINSWRSSTIGCVWPVYTTLYTAQAVKCTLHCTHYTLHITHYTLHTTHYTLHTTYLTLHLHTADCSACSADSAGQDHDKAASDPVCRFLSKTLQNIHYGISLHTAHFPLHFPSAHPTMHNDQCILHTAHLTLHNAHRTVHPQPCRLLYQKYTV